MFKNTQTDKTKLSESPIIHFIRSVVLLAIFIFLPGIAIFWNHLPKELLNKPASNPTIPKTEKTNFFRRDADESAKSVSVFVPESIYPVLPETTVPIPPEVHTEDISHQNTQIFPDVAVQQVSWERSCTELPQNFETLEFRLKALGAKYYRLEKWGNRGELFRFSCFVAPSEPYQYEKYFQKIGTDEITVMKAVVADIEKWKNVQ